ncbi:serine/threonine-protein kinase [Streptomyces erythrochromogenes]|uniref:hypothetical protein n=1 Tax=Streptomyces erythrochromogenes TaxID=285574 RepID=UPI0036B8D670
MDVTPPVTDDLRGLALDVPLMTDRVLLELANSMIVAEDLTAYRREQSLSRTLLARIVGRERQRELLTTRALVDGQRALTTWATELSGHARITDLALARVAHCLGETRRHLAQVDARVSTERAELAEVVARIAELCASRFTGAEARIAALERRQADTELRLAAEEALALSVGRWAAGQSYTGMPWPVRVVLLSAEVAAGPAGAYASHTGRDTYGERLVNAVLTAPRTDAPQEGFALAELLDTGCAVADPSRLLLAAEVLGSGLEPSLAPPAGPITAVTGTALELWTLPGSARPPRPTETAAALVRRRHGWWTSRTSSPRHFVERAVAEQAGAAHALRGRAVRASGVPAQATGAPGPGSSGNSASA